MDTQINRIFRVISIFIIIYSLLTIVSRVVSTIQTSINIDNPLIPKYLIWYVAFPLVFIIPIFGLSSCFCWKNIKKDNFNKPILLFLLALVLFHFLFPGLVYDFIDNFNPYGS